MPEVIPTHRWTLPEPATDDTASLARDLGIPELAARLIFRRGHRTAEAIRDFLNPSPGRLNRPDSLPDIKPATERILTALDRGERICVYGDYDVDGVTGTVLLVSALRRLGGDVVYYLPHRTVEGYGLSMAGIDFCREKRVGLLLTNDCGSTDSAEVAAAGEAHIDVIITDHHETPADLPAALAIVNPKRPDSEYPFSELAGVGVAFKLAWSVLAALDRPREELTDLLDLVGLGTIADVVPLIDENRILARIGLNAIRDTKRPGLQALLRKTGIGNRQLAGYDVGFILGPRLNAAGRVDHARSAAELLLTEEPERAAELATELNTMNRNRQALEENVLGRAVDLVESQKLQEQRVIVVAGQEWHQGVLGIVASRLVERYYRPCIVIAFEHDHGKGSGRSIAGFNLYASLQACAEHLTAFGGHKHAAGVRIEEDRIDDFRQAINRFAASLPEEIYQPSLRVEAVVDLDEIDEDLLQALQQMEPFGPGNPVPLLASFGLEIIGYPRRIGRNHLKLKVRSGTRVLEAIAWKRSHELPNLEVGTKGHIDICYTVDRHSYNGRTNTRLTLRDLRTHHSGQEPDRKEQTSG